jgi:hypothetical protein
MIIIMRWRDMCHALAPFEHRFGTLCVANCFGIIFAAKAARIGYSCRSRASAWASCLPS